MQACVGGYRWSSERYADDAESLRQKYSGNPESSRPVIRVRKLGRHKRHETRTACHLDVFRGTLTLKRSASYTRVLDGKQILGRHRQYNMK